MLPNAFKLKRVETTSVEYTLQIICSKNVISKTYIFDKKVNKRKKSDDNSSTPLQTIRHLKP